MRTATVERKTRETEIAVSLDLDGTGEYDVDTGIGFLDHMLESFSRHSLIDLKVRAQGDLRVRVGESQPARALVQGQASPEAARDAHVASRRVNGGGAGLPSSLARGVAVLVHVLGGRWVLEGPR